jgi:hypothetical protein
MRRVLRDALISMAALALLFVSLVLIDPRVRERLAALASGTPGSSDAGCRGWQCLGGEVREVSSMAMEVASNQLMLHTSLAAFTFAALVLVLFMVRT